MDAVAWAERCADLGAGEILVTSMDRDGTRHGFDVELTRAIVDTVGVPVVASGGVGNLEHLVEGATLGRCRRRVGGVDLPPPGVHRGPGEGLPRRARRGRPAPRTRLIRRPPARRGHPPSGVVDVIGYGAPVASEGKAARSTSPSPPSKQQPIIMLADRVLAQTPVAEGERRSRSGILIPATAQVSRRLLWAEVVAVGPHVRSIKVGDKVLFNPEDRFEVEVQGDEYVILRERDIHAVASERIDSGTGLYL